jgi:hypothetical protein
MLHVAKFPSDMSISPIFKLASRERWRPVGVEESCTAAGIKPPPLAAGRNLDFPADMKPPELPTVMYHRVAEAGNLSWHQFWSWWPYNPKTYAGIGAHEGDWELVQIGCADREGKRPVLVTCSQHSGGEKRMWHRVALSPEQSRPVIYVARELHAAWARRSLGPVGRPLGQLRQQPRSAGAPTGLAGTARLPRSGPRLKTKGRLEDGPSISRSLDL